MKVKFLFAWYDLWIGLFWDKKKCWLYILPIPMTGIIVQFVPEGFKVEPVKTLWINQGIRDGYMALHGEERIGVFKTRLAAIREVWKYRRTL